MSRKGTSGFTLLEVLVVLALMATMAGLTMVSFGSGDRANRVETEAMLLAKRLSLASDEALLTGAEFSLRIGNDSYVVDRWSEADEAWQNDPNGVLGAHHDLAAGITMNVEPAVGRLPIRPNGLSPPATIILSGPGEKWRVAGDGLSARATPLER